MKSQNSKVKIQNYKLKVKIFILFTFALNFYLFTFTFLLESGAESDISSLERVFLEGKYEKAVSEARGLIESRSRQRYEVYYLKGLSELKLKKFGEARQSFQSIIDKYPGSPRLFDAYTGIGDSYFLEGRTSSAARAYKEILEKFPGDKNISMVHSRMKECDAETGVKGRPAAAAIEAPRADPGSSISVQVGSFKNRRNADKFAKKLAGQGFDSFIEISTGSSDRLYRVKIGRLQSSQSAEALAARLRAKGYNTKICPAR